MSSNRNKNKILVEVKIKKIYKNKKAIFFGKKIAEQENEKNQWEKNLEPTNIEKRNEKKRVMQKRRLGKIRKNYEKFDGGRDRW